MRQCIVCPEVVSPVDPGGLHAGIQRAQHIQRCVVAHMQHVVRLHTCGTSGGMKNARIRLANAKGLRADRSLKIRPESNAGNVCIAVGQGHQRVTRGQKFQRQQRIVEQRDLMPRSKKHFKTLICQ